VQIISFANFNLPIFRQKTGRYKILNWMVRSIQRI